MIDVMTEIVEMVGHMNLENMDLLITRHTDSGVAKEKIMFSQKARFNYHHDSFQKELENAYFSAKTMPFKRPFRRKSPRVQQTFKRLKEKKFQFKGALAVGGA